MISFNMGIQYHRNRYDSVPNENKSRRGLRVTIAFSILKTSCVPFICGDLPF